MKRQYLVEIATPVITPITVEVHSQTEAKMIALENGGEIGDLSYKAYTEGKEKPAVA